MRFDLLLAMLSAATAAYFRNLTFQRFPGIKSLHGGMLEDAGDSTLSRAVVCATGGRCHGFNIGPSGIETVFVNDRAGPFTEDPLWVYYKKGTVNVILVYKRYVNWYYNHTFKYQHI